MPYLRAHVESGELSPTLFDLRFHRGGTSTIQDLSEGGKTISFTGNGPGTPFDGMLLADLLCGSKARRTVKATVAGETIASIIVFLDVRLDAGDDSETLTVELGRVTYYQRSHRGELVHREAYSWADGSGSVIRSKMWHA